MSGAEPQGWRCKQQLFNLRPLIVFRRTSRMLACGAMFATILISVAPRLLAQAAGQSQLQAETNPTLSSAVKVFVREFRFQGNTVFLARELAQVVGHYLQRELDSGELEDARRALTLHYVSKGYVNSGAVLDDQPVTDGVITFRIVEGRLSQIDVRSNAWLRASYIRR